jgi:DNA invertase Pin-like site-specific DNA recombinase
MTQPLVAYYRVSTRHQGDTGYGLDAQVRDVDFLRQRLNTSVLDEFKDIESGSRCNRPGLMAAITRCKSTGAKLCVAKLDRLTRSLHLLLQLRDAKVPFVCADNPDANELTITLLCVIAEDELRRIRERTCAGLASAKRRGVLLGSARPGHWEGREHLRGWNAGLQEYAKQKSAEIRHCYEHLLPLIEMMRQRGDTYQQITDWLNSKSYKTSKNRPFSKSVVHEITVRYLGTVEKTTLGA